jgi:hypothetical protein
VDFEQGRIVRKKALTAPRYTMPFSIQVTDIGRDPTGTLRVRTRRMPAIGLLLGRKEKELASYNAWRVTMKKHEEEIRTFAKIE